MAASTTRSAIWDAAHRLFAERGYAGTSVRDIAGVAGVDPALVIRHFTSKETLFLDTMRVELEHDAVLDGPLETLGERYIRYLLDADGRVRNVFLALVRASDSAEVGSRLRDAHEEAFVEPLRQRLPGADAGLRSRLAAAVVGGLLYSLWVVGDEELLAMDHADLAREYGRVLQGVLTPTAGTAY